MNRTIIIIALQIIIILLLVYDIFFRPVKIIPVEAEQDSIDSALTSPHTDTIPKDTINPYRYVDLEIKIIPSINNTWGYQILINQSPLIHQPNIPAMPGNAGFKTKEQAQKVAELVVSKIRNNEMPPSVTLEELHKLKVLE